VHAGGLPHGACVAHAGAGVGVGVAVGVVDGDVVGFGVTDGDVAGVVLGEATGDVLGPGVGAVPVSVVTRRSWLMPSPTGCVETVGAPKVGIPEPPFNIATVPAGDTKMTLEF